MANPPLPPGFELIPPQSSVPPLPPGFELVAPADFRGVSVRTDTTEVPEKTSTQRLVEEGRLPASLQIPVESLEQGLRAARQGLSFGFADELAGLGAGAKALVTGGDAGEAYTTERDRERALSRQFAQDYPAANVLGQVGGGLVTAAAPARAVAAAPSFLSRLGRAIPTGAAYGGVAGLGAGEGDVEQQVGSTAQGALIGAVAAPVVTAGLAGVSRLGSLIPERFIPGRGVVQQTVNVPVQPGAAAQAGAVPSQVPVQVDARGRALDLVAETVRRSGVTPEQIEAQLIRNEQLGAKPEILADFLGDQGGRRLFTTRTLGGEGATAATERLAARGEGTAARVSEDVQRATSQRGQSLTQLEDRIDTRRRMGNTLYQRAFQHGEVSSPDTLALLQNPRVAQTMKAAEDRAAAAADFRGDPSFQRLFREGEAGPELARNPTVADIHRLKTSLDDDIRQAYNAGEGQLGRALKDFKDRIVSNLENEVPAYRKARETYKGDIEIEEAITSGRTDILRKPVDELRRDFAALSGAEQDAYRSGAIDTILAQKVDRTVDSADFARKLWGNADSRNRLQLLVKNEDELVNLARNFDREQRIASTNRNVLGGSQTAMRQSDIEDQLAGTAADVATQGVTNAFVNTVGRWIRRAGGLTEPVADDVARLLTAESPETIRAVLQSLQGREQMRVLQALNQQRAAQGTATVSAQQGTR